MPDHFLLYVAAGMAAYVWLVHFLDGYIFDVPEVFLNGNLRLLGAAYVLLGVACVLEVVA